jgi:hypothetical protein
MAKASRRITSFDNICFNDLQRHWYQKIKEETDFEEIEDLRYIDKGPRCKDLSHLRPLKEWHTFKYTTEDITFKKSHHNEYQEKADAFVNHPTFKDACEAVAEHGNSAVNEVQIELIWLLHCEGQTERKIAETFKRSKTCVHRVVAYLREWMKHI